MITTVITIWSQTRLMTNKYMMLLLQGPREIVNKSKSINSNTSIDTDKNNDKQIYSNNSVPHRVIAYAFGKVKTTWVVSSFQSYGGI